MKISLLPKSLSVMLALLFVVACGPIVDFPGSGEASRLFQLNAKSGLVGASTETAVTILVDRPTLPGGLSSDFIAVRSGGHEIKYLSGARWSDRTGDLFARFVVETIQLSGTVSVIGVESLDLPNDFRLKLDIQDFSANAGTSEDGPIRSVEVRVSATIVRSRPVEIIATRGFASSVAVSDQDPANIVAALNIASDEVLQEMFSWLLGALHEAEPAVVDE